MRIGDVVIPNPPTQLASDGVQYPCAIVCWLDPLVLVSVDTAAIWHGTVSASQVTALCEAGPDVRYHCMQRLPEAMQHAYKAMQPRSAAEVYGAMIEAEDAAMIRGLKSLPERLARYTSRGATPAVASGGHADPQDGK